MFVCLSNLSALLSNKPINQLNNLLLDVSRYGTLKKTVQARSIQTWATHSRPCHAGRQPCHVNLIDIDIVQFHHLSERALIIYHHIHTQISSRLHTPFHSLIFLFLFSNISANAAAAAADDFLKSFHFFFELNFKNKIVREDFIKYRNFNYVKNISYVYRSINWCGPHRHLLPPTLHSSRFSFLPSSFPPFNPRPLPHTQSGNDFHNYQKQSLHIA